MKRALVAAALLLGIAACARAPETGCGAAAKPPITLRIANPNSAYAGFLVPADRRLVTHESAASG